MALVAQTINTVLAQEANRLGPDIYRKTVNTTPWQKLIKQEAWPEEMGEVISMLTYQRSIPDSKLSWKPIRGYTPGSTEATTNYQGQIAPVTNIDFGQTLVSFNLQHTAVKSPTFDVNSLRHAFKRKEQLANIFQILEDAVRWSWDERKRDEYIRLCKNKMVLTNVGSFGIPTSSVIPPAVANDDDTFFHNALAFPSVAATSEVSQSFLTSIRMRMIRDGAGKNPLGRENGAPVFGLICSSELSERVLFQIDKMRTDLNYGNPSELLKPLGVERSFKGFYHIIDDFMPRYKFVDAIISSASGATITSAAHGLTSGDVGQTISIMTTSGGSPVAGAQRTWQITAVPLATTVTLATPAGVAYALGTLSGQNLRGYVEVRPYLKTSGIWDLNPAYLDALYESAVIFHEDVYRLLMPAPISAPGGNQKFDPVSYRGDFKFLNVQNVDTASAAYNPDGTIGHFRGVLASGSKPVRAEWGYAIIALRPGALIDHVTSAGVVTGIAIDNTVDRVTLTDDAEVGEV